MSKKYGIGIIGAGNISAAYLKLGRLFKDIEMRAIADLVPAAATERASEFDVDARSIDQLLASDDIDVVVNLTIPDAHYDVSCAILDAGKHAYSEKPLCLSLEQGNDLKARAKKAGRQVGCAPDTVLGGAHQWARKLIDDNRVGKITHGTCHVLSKGMEHWHPNPDFFFLPGAGPVLDIGPYYIANLINLIGPAKRVAAMTGMASAERTITSDPRAGEKIPVKTPTTLHALIEFANGAIITLGASWDVFGHGHSPMELYGTGGTIFVPDPNFFGGDVSIADTSGEREIVAPWDHPLAVPNQPGENGGAGLANYRCAGLADMVRAIEGNRPPRCSLQSTLHGVDIMTSILKSGESGEFVELTTTCAQPALLAPQEAGDMLVAS
ncbi:MAG: Gfo/Idh/MocA family oxidoreductase [Alphaproteobacteria bacterium]|nr:Gfo/Idh/MocA family oxidoreductase [Alphaproteobacteria bacterium]